MNALNLNLSYRGLFNGLVISVLACGFMPLVNLLDPSLQILYPCLLTVVVILLNRVGFAHPLNCCLPFMLLATAYYPAYQWLEGNFSETTTQVLNIHTLFFLGYLVAFLSCDDHPFEFFPEQWFGGSNGDSNAVSVLVYLSLGLGVLGLYMVSEQGVSSKREMLDARGFSLGYTFVSFLMLTPFAVIVSEFWALQRGSGRLISKSTIYISVTLVFAVLISGERDLLFRFVIFLVVFFLDIRLNFKRWFVFVILAAILLSGPASQNLKGVFLRKSSLEVSDVMSVYNKPSSIFYQEFAASGRNLSILIEEDVEGFMGKTYLNDIGRFFYLPGFESAGQWYNRSFRLDHGLEGSSGWGFTLSGEAYINFGYLGVFCFALIHGLLITILYRIRTLSGFHYAIYCSAVFAFIYVQRADLANLLSFTLKSPLIFAITISIFVLLTRRTLGLIYAKGQHQSGSA